MARRYQEAPSRRARVPKASRAEAWTSSRSRVGAAPPPRPRRSGPAGLEPGPPAAVGQGWSPPPRRARRSRADVATGGEGVAAPAAQEPVRQGRADGDVQPLCHWPSCSRSGGGEGARAGAGQAPQGGRLGPDQPPGQVVPADLHVADGPAVAADELDHRLAVEPDGARGRSPPPGRRGPGRPGRGRRAGSPRPGRRRPRRPPAAQPPPQRAAAQGQGDGRLGQPGPLGHAVAVLADRLGRGPARGQRHQHSRAGAGRAGPPTAGPRGPRRGPPPHHHLDRRGRPSQHLGQPLEFGEPAAAGAPVAGPQLMARPSPPPGQVAAGSAAPRPAGLTQVVDRRGLRSIRVAGGS